MTTAGVKAGIKDLAKAYGSIKAPPPTHPATPLSPLPIPRPSPRPSRLVPRAPPCAARLAPHRTPLTPHLTPHLTSPLKASLVACKEHVAELNVAKLALALETGFEHPATFLFEAGEKLVSHPDPNPDPDPGPDPNPDPNPTLPLMLTTGPIPGPQPYHPQP